MDDYAGFVARIDEFRKGDNAKGWYEAIALQFREDISESDTDDSTASQSFSDMLSGANATVTVRFTGILPASTASV
jgi:hypothetical protein